MSSKLHRGGIAAEPINWDRVASEELPNRELVDPHLSWIAPAKGAPAAALDTEQKLREAFQQGQTKATQEMSAQIHAMQVKLARTIEELTGLRHRFRHEAEEDVVRLALAIARRILH